MKTDNFVNDSDLKKETLDLSGFCIGLLRRFIKLYIINM